MTVKINQQYGEVGASEQRVNDIRMMSTSTPTQSVDNHKAKQTRMLVGPPCRVLRRRNYINRFSLFIVLYNLYILWLKNKEYSYRNDAHSSSLHAAAIIVISNQSCWQLATRHL